MMHLTFSRLYEPNFYRVGLRLTIGLAGLMISIGVPALVKAQNAPDLEQAPHVIVPDQNGVDLRTGKIGDYSFKVSLGPAGNPAIETVFQRRAGSGAPVGSPFNGRTVGVHCYEYYVASWCNNYRRVEFAGYSEWFTSSTGIVPFTNIYGETYTLEGSYHVVTLRDGTRVRFDPSKAPPQDETDDLILGTEYDIAVMVDYKKPNGETVSSAGWTYDTWNPSHGPNTAGPSYSHANSGYAVKYGSSSRFVDLSQHYCSSTGTCESGVTSAKTVTGTFSNLSDASGGASTRSCTIVNSTDITCTATDRSGRSYQWTERRFDYYFQPMVLFSYTAVVSVNRAGNVTNYSYTFDWHLQHGGRITSTTATYPNGQTRTVRMPLNDVELYVKDGSGPETQIKMMGGLGRFDGPGVASSDYKSIIYPEGNRLDYEYGPRRNRTLVRKTPKSGSGLPVLESTAIYPATCTNMVICNKPTSVTDFRGIQTDYTYDATHGGVLTETGPADANGVRPQTRYAYTPFYAKIKNASGVLVNAEGPIYKLTKISACMTATAANPASCVGTTDEKVTEFAYNHNNLLLTSETTRNGNSTISVTTAYSYDRDGNVVIVDGPRTDIDDRSYKTYDHMRRPIFEIGGDPDGASSLRRVTIKHHYDLEGRETRTDTGTCGTVSMSGGIPTGCSDFTITSFKRMTYDTSGRLVKTEMVQP